MADKPLYEYAVGKLYHPGKTRWPEGVEHNYREGGHELRLFFSDPSEEEIAGVRTGLLDLALLVEKEMLFLLFQFGDAQGAGRPALPWADASFQWWLNPPEMRSLPNPEPTEQERALLHVTLVNASDGRIEVLRLSTMSPDFSAKLHEAIRRQARSPWRGEAEYNKALSAVYRKYSDTQKMVEAASVRCVGGE